MAERRHDFGAFLCKYDGSSMKDGRDMATADTCVQFSGPWRTVSMCIC